MVTAARHVSNDELAVRSLRLESLLEVGGDDGGREGDEHVQRRDRRRAASWPEPFANLRLEQSRGRKDLIALTVEQLDELGEAALRVHGEFGPVFRAMILFSAYVGLRPGELFALERSDVGWDEVRIRQNLDGTGNLLLELGVSHADVAVQLGHTDGGALVMSTYGHPSEDAARERLKRAYGETVVPIRAADGSQKGRRAV